MLNRRFIYYPSKVDCFYTKKVARLLSYKESYNKSWVGFFQGTSGLGLGHLSVRLELLGVLEVSFFFGFRIYGLALQFGSLDSN